MDKQFLKEMWNFLIKRNGWWFLPVIILVLIVGILIVIGTATQFASPFIYALF